MGAAAAALEENRLTASEVQKTKKASNQAAGVVTKSHSSKDRDAGSYAFAQNQDTKYGFDRWSHSGSWVAYTAHYSRFPSIEFSVVTLCNNQDIDAEDIAEEVMSIFFDGVID